MNLSKSAIQGIGILASLGILAAAGFLVAKPQYDAATQLQQDTQDAQTQTTIRQGRLITLQKQDTNKTDLVNNVDQLLERITSSKDVYGIAAAVVNALPQGVMLTSLSHGDLDPTQPHFKTPDISLDPIKPPIDLTKAAPAPAEDDSTDGSTASPAPSPTPSADDSETVPALAGAPIILTVQADSPEKITQFADTLQAQKRLINVVGITSSVATNTGAATLPWSATIYAYAYANDTAQIDKWQKPAK